MQPISSLKSRLALILLILAILAGIGFIAADRILSALRAADLDEAVRTVRSLKLACDSFAMDNDGVYPSVDTADFYGLPNPKSSNDFFLQLFASGNTNSERIFWIRGSAICNPDAPDDVTTSRGKFDPSKTLQPGDTHWAYFADHENTDHPDAPFMLDSYLPGTTTFDRTLWDNRVIVVGIDSSARAVPLTSHGTLLDRTGKNLLSPASKVWAGKTPKLRQPDP